MSTKKNEKSARILKKLIIPTTGFGSPKAKSPLTGKSTGVSPNSTCNSVRRFNSDRSIKKPLKQKKKLKETPEEDFKFYLPSHLEVIHRIKKITKVNQPMPFAPEIPPPQPRKFQLAYCKKDISSNQLFRNILRNCDLIQDDLKLSHLLSKVKKTERIIRQEADFVRKIRDLKLKTENSSESEPKKQVSKNCSFNKHNKKPVSILRSGIFARCCFD